jgi:hypothetical protein
MKLSHNYPPLIFAIMLFTACTKTDVSAPGSLSQNISNDATAPDLSKCKIRRIYQDDRGQRVSALFSYNKAGNPYSVLYSNGGTGVFNHYFLYDSKNRLSEWRLVWTSVTIESHFYKYNNKNQIVIDSTNKFNGGDGTLGKIFISTIEYDALGRVVKETVVNTYSDDGPDQLEKTHRPTFTYDNRGNLGVLGWKSSSYDHKINPLRQNPVFQFVMRNYSMNNAAVQPRYNSLGLPLSINPSNDVLFNNLVTDKVIYDCQ